MAAVLHHLRHNPWLIALALASLTALWLLSGQVGQTPAPVEAPAAALDPDARISVQVRRSAAQPLLRQHEVRGRTHPWSQALLAAETEGRVIAVQREPGDQVAAGDVILQIDPRARAEVLAQAQALEQQRETEFDAASRLHRQGHINDTQLAQARAALASAQAERQRALLDLEAATLRSPIDGRLEARLVEVGDYLKVGTVAARVAALDRLKLVGYVSERVVADLRAGQPVEILGSGGSAPAAGQVHFVARTADAATRTYVVEIALPNPENRPAGESLRAHIQVGEVPAHQLPVHLIDLDAGGQLGILGVREGSNIVERFPASILQTTTDQAWLGGLPPQLQVITRGQGFVQPGSAVDLQFEEG